MLFWMSGTEVAGPFDSNPISNLLQSLLSFHYRCFMAVGTAVSLMDCRGKVIHYVNRKVEGIDS